MRTRCVIDCPGAGFTLIEVLVALVVGGMALASAAALLSALGNRAAEIRATATRANQEANAERVLRGLAANLALSADTTPSFVGDASSATFRAWCDTPAGWLDHCRVRLVFTKEQSARALRLELRGADSSTIELRRGFQTGRFRYLVNIDHVMTWMDGWSNLVPPTALTVIIDADTLLLPVWGN